MKTEQVVNCMFSSWYPKFKDVTIKSRILPLPQDVLDYLHADGLVLPEGNCEPVISEGREEASDDEDDWDNDDSVPTAQAPSFPEFDSQITSCINALGGIVFPKLNWSSPKDAVWITCDSTLKCTCPADVYLLLKSSDFIAHDLSQAWILCEDYTPGQEPPIQYTVVLRRWQEFTPGGEFRCFVKDKKLKGISQRHNDSYYPFIHKYQDEVIDDISAFHQNTVSPRFPDSDYVFDVYRKEQGKVYLIDINPFGRVTDGLLFEWEELQGDGQLTGNGGDVGASKKEKPAFRYMTSEAGVQPNPYSSYSIPQDFVHLTTGEDPHKLMDLLHLKIQQQNEESSSDEEETETASGSVR